MILAAGGFVLFAFIIFLLVKKSEKKGALAERAKRAEEELDAVAKVNRARSDPDTFANIRSMYRRKKKL